MSVAIPSIQRQRVDHSPGRPVWTLHCQGVLSNDPRSRFGISVGCALAISWQWAYHCCHQRHVLVQKRAAQKYEVRSVCGKGRAVVAIDKIMKGECILRDRAALLLPPSLLRKPVVAWEAKLLALLRKCGKAAHDQFWNLADVHTGDGGKTATGIVLTNFHAATHDGEENYGSQSGVFPLMSRFNHSCTPNVHHSWCGEGVRVAHALTDIDVEQELCVAYIEVCGTRKQRRRELEQKYRFQCHCPTCSLPRESLLWSDRRRNELRRIDSRISDLFDQDDIDGDSDLVRYLIERGEHLIDEEMDGNDQLKCRLLYDGFQLAVECGQAELAADMASRAWKSSVISQGQRSPQTQALKQYAESEFVIQDS